MMDIGLWMISWPLLPVSLPEVQAIVQGLSRGFIGFLEVGSGWQICGNLAAPWMSWWLLEAAFLPCRDPFSARDRRFLSRSQGLMSPNQSLKPRCLGAPPPPKSKRTPNPNGLLGRFQVGLRGQLELPALTDAHPGTSPGKALERACCKRQGF